MLDGRQMRCLSVISSLKKPRTFQMDDALFNYFFSSSAWHRLKNQLARKTQNTFNYFFQQTLQPPVYRKTSKTRMTLYPWPPTLHTSLPRIPELHPPFLQSPPRGIWLHFSCWVQFIRDHGDGHLKAGKIIQKFHWSGKRIGAGGDSTSHYIRGCLPGLSPRWGTEVGKKNWQMYRKLYTRLVGPHPLFRLSSRNSVWRRFRYSTYGNQCVGLYLLFRTGGHQNRSRSGMLLVPTVADIWGTSENQVDFERTHLDDRLIDVERTCGPSDWSDRGIRPQITVAYVTSWALRCCASGQHNTK